MKDLLARREQAYEMLLNRYEAALYRFFYYSHGNRELAQDQCGETFEALIRNINKMRSNKENSIKSFLFGIARNVMHKSWRAKQLQKQETTLLEDITDNGASVFRTVAAREELRRALNVIYQFPQPQKQVLLLRFVERFKLSEIAEVMDMPLNSVKSCINRSRKKLLQLLYDSKSHKSEV